MAGSPKIISLLGRPTGVGTVRGNKPWAITAFLVLAGSTSRGRLIELLFDEAEHPAAALRWNLAQVRRLVGKPDALSGPVLSLPRDRGVAFDVDLVIDGNWHDAVDLPSFGAELLEGMQFPGCPAYETWLLGERRRLAAAADTLLYDATMTLLSEGRLAEAVRSAARLVALSPCVDSHQELLIRAYAISGDGTAARQQLQSAVRLFRRQLDCDPEPSVFLAAEVAPAPSSGPATPARVQALVEAGRSQVAAGATQAAIQVMLAACDEAQRTGQPALEAKAQLALGATLIGSATARHQEGELALHRAISHADEAGDPSLAASAYRHLAGSDVLRGSYARADRRLAASIADAPADAEAEVELAAIGGVSRVDQGDIEAAIEVFRRGLTFDPDRTHPFLPIMLAHLGRAYLLAGDSGAARGPLEESLALSRSRAWAGVTAAPLALLGHVALAEDELDTARELLEQAFARACQVSDPCWETWSTHGLGLHANAIGDHRTAVTHLADAVARSRPERGGHLWSRVWAIIDAVRVARQVGDTRGETWYADGLATAQRCGMRQLADDLLHIA